ncbi:uncharacterized protein ACOB8E_018695 [Sarcophilus harrisii]
MRWTELRRAAGLESSVRPAGRQAREGWRGLAGRRPWASNPRPPVWGVWGRGIPRGAAGAGSGRAGPEPGRGRARRGGGGSRKGLGRPAPAPVPLLPPPYRWKPSIVNIFIKTANEAMKEVSHCQVFILQIKFYNLAGPMRSILRFISFQQKFKIFREVS